MQVLRLQILWQTGALVFLAHFGGEANPVKRFLQTRNVGLCMCHNRLLGFHVVRSAVATVYLWPQFAVDANTRVERSPDHKENVPNYPDSQYFLNEVQYYYSFRDALLRHLRVAQFARYFARQDGNTHRREYHYRRS